MATQTRRRSTARKRSSTKRRAPARRPTSGRARSSASKGRSTAARSGRSSTARARGSHGRRRPPQRRRKPSALQTTLGWIAAQIRDAPPAAWGVVVAAIGVVAWLGVYARAAGPIGSGIRYLGRLAVGELAAVVPLILLAAGIGIIVSRARPHVARIVVGLGITTIAIAGMRHLAMGAKPVTAPLEKLQRIGGVTGALASRPLSDVAGTWLTWIVLLLVYGIGVMVVTKTP
ncbi:MAG TPA: DNA translocase FtsK 4TM domain-containing protein, partial [Actinomycetota bacterium]